jgi:MFS family permease
MRGRVMSFYTMAFFGMQPFGSFLTGILADHIGARSTLALQGAAGILTAIVFVPLLLKKEIPANVQEQEEAVSTQSQL